MAWLSVVAAAGLFAGCGDDDDTSTPVDSGMTGVDGSTPDPDGGTEPDPDGGTVEEPDVAYAFESRFEPGTSSVSYSGQVFRQVLISDLNTYIAGLSDDIDSAAFAPAEDGDVVAALDFYFRFDSASNGGEDILLTTDPNVLQMTYDDISSDKDLVGKLAGNDTVTDHSDWSTEFAGWSDASIADHGGSIDTPEGLVTAFFETLEENALGRAEGDTRMGPDGEVLAVYVTEDGLDLKQLIQKFLLGAVAFQQGTDDYLDSDVEGKGLLADNTAADDGDPYSSLEHQWDEGFGYFGAARNYDEYTDEEIAGKGGRDGWAMGYHDTDGDEAIDLLSEYNFGNSVNAGKRDLGAAEAAATDFTEEAFQAFVMGRTIITEADGALDETQMAALEEQRDIAVLAWEKAIAATVVHYINDTLQVMNTFDSEDYDFAEHAKVWSELKGFALGFQFNPRSPMNEEDRFTDFHTLVGDAPVLPTADEADVTAYRQALLDARDILQTAYEFDDANMGDDNGEGGW